MSTYWGCGPLAGTVAQFYRTRGSRSPERWLILAVFSMDVILR
jgi:hypothetical protein